VIGRSQLSRAMLADAAHSLDQALTLFDDGTLSAPAMQAGVLSERAMVAYEQGGYEASVRLLERASALLESTPGADPAQSERTRARLADMLVVSQRIPEAIEAAGTLIRWMRDEGRTGAESYGYALRVMGAATNAARR